MYLFINNTHIISISVFLHFEFVNNITVSCYPKYREESVMKINFELLGKRISQRRHELGLKQCMLAEKSGISNNYLSNIENGRSIPSLETFADICLALSVTPDCLLLGTIRTDDIPQSIVNNLKMCDEYSLSLIDDIINCFLKKQNNK